MNIDFPPVKEHIKNLIKIDAQPNITHAEFLTREEYYSVFPEPIPAQKNLPGWFERLNMFDLDENGKKYQNKTTAKACAPLLEGMTTGWILRTPVDLYFETHNGQLGVDVPDNSFDFDPVFIHDEYVWGGNKNLPGDFSGMIQFGTPWIISVPNGYSIWQLPLLNRWEYEAQKYFYPFSGIRDVDARFNYINQTCFLKPGDSMNYRMKSGTPISQFVIIDRNSFINTATVRPTTEEENLKYLRNGVDKLRNGHRYREEVWHPIPSPRNIHKDQNGCPFK
jgi:hypothetical protein